MFKLEGLHSIDPHTTYIDGAAVSQQSHIYNRPWWVSNDGVGLACCRSIAPVDWLSRNNLQQHRGRYYGGVICSSQLYRAPINSYPWRERGIIHTQSSLDIPDQMALNFHISSHRDTQGFPHFVTITCLITFPWEGSLALVISNTPVWSAKNCASL